METVEVASGGLELLDPFMWLDINTGRSAGRSSKWHGMIGKLKRCCAKTAWVAEASGADISHLHDHHMTVKGAPAMGLSWTVNVRPDLGDHGSSEGDIRDEVTVHDVDMEPV